MPEAIRKNVIWSQADTGVSARLSPMRISKGLNHYVITRLVVPFLLNRRKRPLI